MRKMVLVKMVLVGTAVLAMAATPVLAQAQGQIDKGGGRPHVRRERREWWNGRG
jgi:hypothetical protein